MNYLKSIELSGFKKIASYKWQRNLGLQPEYIYRKREGWRYVKPSQNIDFTETYINDFVDKLISMKKIKFFRSEGMEQILKEKGLNPLPDEKSLTRVHEFPEEDEPTIIPE